MPHQEESSPQAGSDTRAHEGDADAFGFDNGGSDPAPGDVDARNPYLGRAEERINDALRGTADRIQAAAERLGDFAGARFSGTEGAVGRAGDLTHSLADSLERLADYVRGADFEALRHTVERSARDRPIQTILAGVAAGWVAGKLVR